jgi:small-conductance mechanosensitive channel
VAAHYRFWLRALWFWTLIALPVYLFVARLELGPNIAQALYTLYAAGALAPVILLARDRPSVLRVVGRPFAQRHPRSLAAVARMYPLFVIFLVALLIVVLVGHGAFVGYLVRGSLQTAAALVVAVGLSQLLKEFVRKHGGTLETPPHAKKEEPPQDDDIDHFFREAESHEWGLILSTAATIGFAAIWAGTVLWIGAAWGLTWQNAERILNYEVLARGAAEPVTTSRIVGGLFIFVLSFKFSRILRAFLESQIYPAYANFNKAARATVNTLLHYTIVLIGLYLALHTLRLNFGALAVLLGGLGLGLGLGLQPLVINFVSGLVIFAERHVKVGDIVKVGDDTGEVSGISMRSTQVKLFDGVDLIIPNSEFVTSRVTNWTYRDTRLRGDIKLRVPYGVDVKKVRDILVDIANREPRVLAYPAPGCGFDFGESAYTYTLGSWFPAPPDRDAGILAMRYEIVRRFAEEGIEFAFPHQTLTFNGSELPVRIETSPTTPPAVAGGTNGEPNNPAAPSELAPPAKTTTNKP